MHYRSWARALLACISIAACSDTQDAYMDYKVKALARRAALNEPDKVHVLLCGTGSPQQADRSRAQACTLVAAGGRLFLFDAGEGATPSLASLGVPVEQIRDVFITHWHSDHFNGLGSLVNAGWIAGRVEPLALYGPPGVGGVVQGLETAYALDVGFRAAHTQANDALAVAEPHEVRIAADKRYVRVYARDGVTIDAYRVAHPPVDPSYGYVLRYGGRKIFISGDTRVDPVYLPAMDHADLVVHEAIQSDLIHRAAAAMRRNGLASRAAVAEKILGYHADTLALASMAQVAEVRHLLLTHLIPSPDSILAKHLFVKGMGDLYSGRITLGEDGTHVVLGTDGAAGP